MTRFTFTSVVWAESITATRSSSSFEKRSAIVASACSVGEALDDRADAGAARADLAARLGDEAARHLAEGRLGLAQAQARADDVERGTAGAGHLGRPRAELAGVDPRDRLGEPRLELRAGRRACTRATPARSGRSRNW